MAVDTEFNGMVDSVLPNVYTKRIILEQKNFSPPDRDNTLNAYIAEDTPKINIAQKLKVTLDMVVKLPNIQTDELLGFLFNDDLVKYLTVYSVVFATPGGKNLYNDVLSNKIKFGEFVTAINQYDANNKAPLNKLISDNSAKLMFVKKKLSKLLELNGATTAELERFKVVLPDESEIFEIPYQRIVEFSSVGPKPGDLAAISFATLDFNAVKDDLDVDIPEDLQVNTIGRINAEVIIKNNSLQQNGMIFIISPNQEDTEHIKAFAQHAGQVWLGASHKRKQGGKTRYMAGNFHKDELHPYLDAFLVPNNKIQDFRQVARFQKSMFDLNPAQNKIFGGSYKVWGADEPKLDGLPITSPLFASRTKQGQIRLFFGLDFGKLIKKKCAVPAILDKFSQDPSAYGKLQGLLNRATLLSYRIYRKRVDIDPKTLSQDFQRQLIYSTTDNLKAYETTEEVQSLQNKPPVVSAMAPVVIDEVLMGLNGFYKHYSLTDYDKSNTKNGMFKYSIELELKDPTIDYLSTIYKQISVAIDGDETRDGLKHYASKSKLKNAFNATLGEFRENFIEDVMTNPHYTAGVPLLVNNVLKSGTVTELLTLARSRNTLTKTEFNTTIVNLLDPHGATPDSIDAALNIFVTIAEQLRNFVNSYATSDMPKAGKSNSYANAQASVTSNSNAVRTIIFENEFNEVVDNRHNDAGYDYLITVENSSENQRGLKLVQRGNFANRITNEKLKYFAQDKVIPTPDETIDDTFSFTLGFPVGALGSAAAAGSGVSETVTTSISETAYRYLSLQSGGVVLPTSIKNEQEEKNYWQLITNIIRYKNELFGNYTGGESTTIFTQNKVKQSALFGNQDDAKKAKREFLLKNLQALSALGGATFKTLKDYEVKENLISMGEKNFESSKNTLGMSGGAGTKKEDAISTNNFLGNFAEEMPPDFLSFPGSDLKQISADLNLYEFAIAMLNMDLFNFRNKDLLLEQFDPSIYGNRLTSYAEENALNNPISQLPNQIKALLLANSNETLLAPKIKYKNENNLFSIYGKGQLYPQAFGTFWFKHQNIVEIEYLTGYAPYVLSQATSAKTYEQKFNQSISIPQWAPLSQNIVDNLQNFKMILCRMKRYNSDMVINKEAYKMLDMPIYDQYFLLMGGEKVPFTVSTNQLETGFQAQALQASTMPDNVETSLRGDPAAAGSTEGSSPNSAGNVKGTMAGQAEAAAAAKAAKAADIAAAAIAKVMESTGATEEEVKIAAATGLALMAALAEKSDDDEEDAKVDSEAAVSVLSAFLGAGTDDDDEEEGAFFVIPQKQIKKEWKPAGSTDDD